MITMSTYCTATAQFIEGPATFEEIAEAVGGPAQARILINTALEKGTAMVHNASKNNAWPVKVHANLS